ncbi:hypothetical protein [Methylobacterium nonmethylotrophicum]|uniref:Uncharacterized protein n=1 Tax=Methylobacterium nonmethylotrophicum TaxID=1141884 RepID=A0A4Z0NWS8_9HYPH|nr:hypothetical protein [Methylobacterium nonmethylotrophicum]TGE01737.1 hypothetical protein EU555_03420 [Methylobacterium nonmethylotrophicum]
MPRPVACPSHPTAPNRPGFTRLPNGLDLHAPPVAAGRPLLPRRLSPSALALVLFALVGWAGLLAWTRLDPAAPCAACLDPAAPCAACTIEPGRL